MPHLSKRKPEHFTPRRAKCSPCRADYVGAGRDKVALPTGQTDILLIRTAWAKKYPGKEFFQRYSSRGGVRPNPPNSHEFGYLSLAVDDPSPKP